MSTNVDWNFIDNVLTKVDPKNMMVLKLNVGEGIETGDLKNLEYKGKGKDIKVISASFSNEQKQFTSNINTTKQQIKDFKK